MGEVGMADGCNPCDCCQWNTLSLWRDLSIRMPVLRWKAGVFWCEVWGVVWYGRWCLLVSGYKVSTKRPVLCMTRATTWTASRWGNNNILTITFILNKRTNIFQVLTFLLIIFTLRGVEGRQSRQGRLQQTTLRKHRNSNRLSRKGHHWVEW